MAHASAMTPPPLPGTESRAKPPGSLVALWEDGRTYNGDIVGDIVDYRRLRAGSLAGACVTSAESQNLHRLEQRLRASSSTEERREFHRFQCKHTAKVVAFDREGQPSAQAEMVDLGGGGAKVELDFPLEPGERVHLVVKVSPEVGTSVDVTFECRVAWSREGAVGIMFAGPPKSSRTSLL